MTGHQGHPTYIPVTTPGLDSLTPAELDRAREVVTGRARDDDDRDDLLGMVGLIDERAERAAAVRGDGA